MRVSELGPRVQEAVRSTRSSVSRFLDSKWEKDPLVAAPRGTRSEYLAIFDEARRRQYPEIERVERECGYAIDRQWLDNLALHTQVTIKRSVVSYAHGRLVYSLLRRYLAENKEEYVTVLETGTARGFSSLCMSKAIDDAGCGGVIVTLDVLPHLAPIFWNCIDDLDGRHTRAELLHPWEKLASRVVFVQGDTLSTMRKIGLSRVNFAFLDAQHLYSNVMSEIELIAPRQRPGDMIVFDDVTPSQFPGVVRAVAELEARGQYRIETAASSESRGYAWATRKGDLG